MTPPRKPGALTLPTLSRLAGRVVCGLALVWMVALVGWPERPIASVAGKVGTGGELRVFFTLGGELQPRSRPARDGEYDYIVFSPNPDSPSAPRTPAFWAGYRRDSSFAVILGKLGR